MVDLVYLKAREETNTTPDQQPLPVDDYFMTIAILSQELSPNENKVSPLHNRMGAKLHKNGALIVLCL